jgi:aldose 1-epimerase
LTNHTFWNLADRRPDRRALAPAERGHGRCASTVISSRCPAPPPGVRGTELDFRDERPVGGARLDNCFVVEDWN